MNKIRSTVSLAVLAAMAAFGAAPSSALAADDGPWLVRVRALNLDPANKDSTGLGLSVNSKLFPEVDISYFFSPNLAAELILTYPQEHDISADGVGKIGKVSHLPPTLTVQYHFTDFGPFKPYVGAGLNYTNFTNVDFDAAIEAALQPSIERDSFGWALQLGFDYEISKGMYLNLDIKKVKIQTDVKSFGTKAGTFKIDPVLVGIGIGWRF